MTREEVIAAFRRCGLTGACGDRCPYNKEGQQCFQNMRHDVLEILKQEEEVPVKRCLVHPNARYPFSCGNCGSYLMPNWIACPMCGRKVKWE